ncbi:MAG: ribulose bisphosphate carboxylase small subunit [Euzebya sp.]
MHLTQGSFSYLPELTDEEIGLQVDYGIEHDWHPQIEFTDDPHPRNTYWNMWGLPMFDVSDGQAVVNEINRCREAHPDDYIRVSLFDPSHGRATSAMQFIVNRPAEEPGFVLHRQETADRTMRYTLQSYAARRPHGQRYGEA